MNKILWLVTARSGSKTLPNKNICILGSYPLLAYRILAAGRSDYGSHIWVSTDSQEYADIAKKYGGHVPFLRPDYLSTDDAQSIDVVLHAMTHAEALNFQFEYIGLLEPTSPFISSDTLNAALHQLQADDNADSIVAVREHRPNTIFVQDDDVYLDTLARNLKNFIVTGRQNFNKQITPSGGFYISKWERLKENNSFYTSKTLSFLVDDVSALEIDEPIDWLFAEFIIERQYFNFSNQSTEI